MPDQLTPPHSPDAERGVLGSILQDMGGRAYDLVTNAGVTEEAFFTPANRILFACVKDMSAKGCPIDPLSLNERLRDQGRLDEVGGTAYLQSLIDETPTSAHVEYYVAILGDKHLKRKAIEGADIIKSEAYKGDKSGDMIRAESEMRFAKMQTVSVKAKRALKQVAQEAYQEWEDNANGVAPLGIQTGIRWLDEATAGIMQQAYWVISGKPGSCKSTLCRMIAENVAQRGTCLAIKTTEKTDKQYIGDMEAALAKFSVHKLNKPGFPVTKLVYLKQAADTVAQWPIFIDGDMVTRSQLSSWFTSSVNAGSRLQILDYIQDTLPDTKKEGENPEQKMTLVTQEIRRLTKVLKVPAIVVSTLSNEGKLRYSGQTEFDVTVYIQMSKADDYDAVTNPKYQAEIIKSRFSPPGTKIPLYYFYGTLLEADEYQAQVAMIARAISLGQQPHVQ